MGVLRDETFLFRNVLQEGRPDPSRVRGSGRSSLFKGVSHDRATNAMKTIRIALVLGSFAFLTACGYNNNNSTNGGGGSGNGGFTPRGIFPLRA